MSEYYDGGADHAAYEGHDAYQGEEHNQYADVHEQVHQVIELIGEKIDGIEHEVYEAKDGEAYEEPKAHDAQQAYASDEYKADDHKADYKADDHKVDDYKAHDYKADDYKADDYKADDYKADDYKGDDYKGEETYSPYARS
jgi:hypothetical protein